MGVSRRLLQQSLQRCRLPTAQCRDGVPSSSQLEDPHSRKDFDGEIQAVQAVEVKADRPVASIHPTCGYIPMTRYLRGSHRQRYGLVIYEVVSDIVTYEAVSVDRSLCFRLSRFPHSADRRYFLSYERHAIFGEAFSLCLSAYSLVGSGSSSSSSSSRRRRSITCRRLLALLVRLRLLVN